MTVSLHQSPISSDTTVTTQLGSKVTSSAIQIVGYHPTWVKKWSVAMVGNDIFMEEKVLTMALTAASGAGKYCCLVFHHGR